MNTPSLLDKYRDMIRQQQLREDPAQVQALQVLQRLLDELLGDATPHGLAQRFRQLLLGAPPVVRGVYLWGGVGRGKSLLMNLFYQTLPLPQKTRMHFHHFMLDVHARLAGLQGQRNARNRLDKNPLKQLARDYAQRYRVICLDEFIVTNITDAMLLYGLLDALFKQRVTLVATSNRIPDDLYLNGLQRERFLPAIELLKQHTEVVHLDSPTDHRSALWQQSRLYLTPLGAETDAALHRQFEALATGHSESGKRLRVQNREIPAVAVAGNIAWFEFDSLCNTPRATPDYIEIAERFRCIIVSNVPVMDEDMDDRARRFIYLIDALYDKRVLLIISAEAEADRLYHGEMLAFAFRRTASRLIEMRSQKYMLESTNVHEQPAESP